LGKVFYSFEGNIHCTGATINWLMNNLKMISSPAEIEEAALSVPDNGGVYIVPAFAGLGAPWWNNDVRAAISGMTLGTERNHILRATLESIAYQIYDLVGTMAGQAGIAVKEMRVDGGPTKNNFLMQYQTDCLRVPVDCSNIEEASALGAVIMNRTALGAMTNFEEIQAMRSSRKRYQPQDNAALMEQYIKGWHNAVSQLLK
jgi:glycerol kinase